ncbi:MAG: FtsX-like permease family protein [Steroidobacteraceae bacterium]|jgi:putative ABC transport system permease protein|nr:FtsX-like permease family protein [Steroidobacteraceae bacterium]
MRSLRFALLALARDWRSGELAVLLASLVVAVTALTAVGFFTDRIGQAVAQQAAEVIAADLRLRSTQEPSAEYVQAAQAQGLSTARTLSFPSVVFFGDDSSLSAIRAVSEGYPLRGAVRISDEPFGPGRVTRGIPGRGEAWLDSRLMARLGVRVGDTVSIGAAQFRVTQVLDYRPDQGSAFVDLAASLLMNIEDIPSTQLLQPGSRATHAILFAGRPADVRAFKTELEARKLKGERIVDAAEESPQIQAAAERAGRFLNLSALITVLLAAVAVAMAARRYVRRHLDNVALMKCMGASQGFVLRVVVLELTFLALLAAAVGAALGFLAQAGLAALLRELIRGELPPPTLAPALLGLATAAIILVGFALPPLLQLKRVPPARVLRRNLEPPPLRYAAAYLFALGGLCALLFALVRDARLVAYVAIGTAVTVAVLYGAGWLLVRAAGRLRGGVGISWRYGLANLSRRGTESIAQVVAFGLGLMVLLLLAVVRNDLVEDWQRSLPADTPNHFLINIPAAGTGDFERFFVERGMDEPNLYPMIRARLTSINGRPVSELTLASDRARGFAEREQNLTWSETLSPGNKLVGGRWWSEADRGRALVSVASDYRDEMGLKLGDQLAFDVAGEPLEAEVSSFREVQWDSFQPNFFLVFSPGTLDGMVGTWLTAVRLTPEQKPLLTDLVRQFPSVSVFDVEAILTQVREVMDRASLAVQYVFVFTLAAGVMVLLAAIQSTRDERRYESAMLRTLGASRRVVLKGVAAEFVALGLLAGLLAAFGATVGGWIIATELFNLDYQFDPDVWVVGLALGVALVGGAGTFAARSVVNHPPIATLRQ